MFTKIKTIKDEAIHIPNLLVLGRNIKNYSSLGKVIVHQKITLGYDVKRAIAEKLLLKAVANTEGLLQEPKPFILIRNLAEFYVEYGANAYTNQPNNLINIYSDLMKNILDVFNERKIELISPKYIVARYTQKK